MKVLHNSCNTVTCALPDMSTLSPRPAALGLWVYISGRALVPVLQLLNVTLTYTVSCPRIESQTSPDFCGLFMQ